MPKKSQPAANDVSDLRNERATRKNIPPPGIAAKGKLVCESYLNWVNRLILGDSLAVIASLAHSWVSVDNNWEQLRKWAFDTCAPPQELEALLDGVLEPQRTF